MNTHADKTQENKSQSVAEGLFKKQSSGESTFQFVDNRPEAVAQRKLQEMANNSPQAMQLRAFQEMANDNPKAMPSAQLQSDNKFVGKTIQLVNCLTMHSPPKDERLAGGGIGSSVNTGAEVAAVIESGNLVDLNDSRKALSSSISVRQDSPADAGHAARIVQEQTWLAQLDAAIKPLEQARLARRQKMLRGRPSSVPAESEGALPAAAGWGGPRNGAAAAAMAPPFAAPTAIASPSAAGPLTVPTPLSDQELDVLYPNQGFAIWGSNVQATNW
ncbi:MAG: hypothetical protein QNK28_05475 [Desulfobacterales bacterium]|nr:hypothetical protein [Desulfobacterales bacterium]